MLTSWISAVGTNEINLNFSSNVNRHGLVGAAGGVQTNTYSDQLDRRCRCRVQSQLARATYPISNETIAHIVLPPCEYAPITVQNIRSFCTPLYDILKGSLLLPRLHSQKKKKFSYEKYRVRS